MPRHVDNSSSERIRLIRSRILSATVTKPVDYDILLAIKDGRAGRRVQPSNGPSYDLPGCCTGCDALVLSASDVYTPPSPYDASYNVAYDLSWNAVSGASSYVVTVTTSDLYTVDYTGLTAATLYINSTSPDFVYQVTITANGVCATSSIISVQPCFLAGSLVQLADGSQKVIEDIVVGDIVLGAFGEANPVLALHRPLMGTARMNRINNEHSTTAHHPHVSADRGFYCAEPATVESSTYGHEHDVIDGAGRVVKRMLHGLKKGRVQRLEVGIVLKTVEGSRKVSTLETYTLPPETQLYNLVTGGSHTYHVDGYAVTGWPREDDWDYDNWAVREN